MTKRKRTNDEIEQIPFRVPRPVAALLRETAQRYGMTLSQLLLKMTIEEAAALGLTLQATGNGNESNTQ